MSVNIYCGTAKDRSNNYTYFDLSIRFAVLRPWVLFRQKPDVSKKIVTNNDGISKFMV